MHLRRQYFKKLAPTKKLVPLLETTLFTLVTMTPPSLPTFTMMMLLLALISLPPLIHAVQDANAPWGDNPPRKFDMYWREPGNVLEDLDQFSALYIRQVGCMWSEYGYSNYDDDGENRDGDENWYQGRTTSFRANAAYSLYGIKRSLHFPGLRKCSRHTYINTFITNNGADAILNITGRLSSTDDFYSGYGHAYCYEADNDDNERELGSGDQDNDNSLSTTMGCSLNGYKYAMAIFRGGYCDGKYFLNTTDSMKDYNKDMSSVKCDKIWDYSTAYNKRQRVDTPADYLLEESSSCSNYMYDGRCPDPYGVNKAYKKAISRGGGGTLIQPFFRVISWMALLVGLVLMGAAYYIKQKRWIRKRGSRLLRGRRKSKRSLSQRRRSMPKESADSVTLPSVELSSLPSSGDQEKQDAVTEEQMKKSSRRKKRKSKGKPKEENIIV